MNSRVFVRLAVGALLLAAPLDGWSQGFDAITGPWGPGRLAAGRKFHSAAERLPDDAFRFGGKDWQVAFGAQYLARLEARDNRDLDSSKNDANSFVSHRARFTLRASLFDKIGFWLEFQDVRTFGEEQSTTSNDAFVGLHQGFVDLKLAPWFYVRVGRQELSYGEDRLVGSLDWAQTARSFDGLFLRFSGDTYSIDTFAMIVREQVFISNPSGNPIPNDGEQLFGIYGLWRPNKKFKLDLYALGTVYDPSAPSTGKLGSRAFATLGFRGQLKVGPVEMMLEAAGQFGSAREGSRLAWAMASWARYTMPVWGKPYFMVHFLRASGDGNPLDDTYTTFSQLFPTAHAHLGFIDYVGWQNVQSVRGTFGMRPWGKAHLWIDLHQFQMVEPTGIWYDAPGRVYIGPDSTRTSSDMGIELDISLTIFIHKHVGISFAYAIFLPGDAARPTTLGAIGRGTDASHWGFAYLRSQF